MPENPRAIINLISEAYRRNPNLLIAGDFNHRELDWLNENSLPGQHHLQDFIENLQNCFLYQHVTEPRRYQGNECTRFDPIKRRSCGTRFGLQSNPGGE